VHATDAGLSGARALMAGPEKAYRGPHDLSAGVAPLHGTGPALAALSEGKAVCLTCHGAQTNPAGVVTCSTGVEYLSAREPRGCTSCHMAEVAGASGVVSPRPTHRSHRFDGPAQAQHLGAPGLLAEAVTLTGRLEGERLVARLENRSAHAFPTGFPGRMAVLVLSATDAEGHEVARNVTTEPLKQHPEAVFNQGYLDAEGKPALAPFATKLARDTRLKPAEIREVTFPVPASAVKAQLQLRFLLVAPGAAKLLGLEGPETKPVTLPAVVVERRR
jgi:hypothetical protein